MPPSQLKRLKASLREAGITGPQKSKKQKKGAKGSNSNAERHEKIQQLRDSFNPFELRAPSARPSKHQHTVNGAASGSLRYKDVLHRPGVAKSVGEDMRRAKLLPEMQKRHKVGGLVDRRIGEGDLRMTAEERAEERFAAGFKTRGQKTKSLFDLEDSDGEEGMDLAPDLLHRGRSLRDIPMDEIEGVPSDEDAAEFGVRKRKRSESLSSASDVNEVVDNEMNGRDVKKSKKEVMQEVIAKSKLHKYERQKAKEDDDDLREELDKEMPDLLSLLRNHKKPQQVSASATISDAPTKNGPAPFMNPERERMLSGEDGIDVDRDYDRRLKQLAQDAKAKPSERTKTTEEKAKEEAERLKDLEERRVKRMRGEEVDDDTQKSNNAEQAVGDDEDLVADEAAEFGFTNAENTKETHRAQQLVLDDEDEFDFDEDLVASGSDVDLSEDSESDLDSANGEANGHAEVDDDEDEFVKGILGSVSGGGTDVDVEAEQTGVAFTYPCPRSHQQLLDVIREVPVEQLTTVIQRIRALHHPSLNVTNKEAMADFSATLVEHLSYMGIERQPLTVTEQVIRHLHSLSRTYPETIARAFRAQLKTSHERRDLHAGDLVILMAIGSIYPTSDHWHQAVTPAMTLMARWLGMNTPDSPEKKTKGAFLVALSVHFQRLSKRLVPEALGFTMSALRGGKEGAEELKSHLQNLVMMADLWKDKSAFIELFTPAISLLKHCNARKELQMLRILLQQSRTNRRPLELHHHRPLAIRTSVPKFEEGFHPDKHYDPDKERSESRKLKNEYKRERKGALRELRKDANFIAREKLREKRETDAEYEKKYRRLVAEVQGEAGRDANEYEREKARRKRKQ